MLTQQTQLESLLAAAVEIVDDTERAAYVERVCRGDTERRAELQGMIRDYFAAGSVLEKPAALALTLGNSTDQVGATIGPYKLLEQIGEGGMGVVYVAEQTEPVRRRVALKIIKPGMDTKQVIARFEAERQALAMMDHPHIAKVLDAGTTAPNVGGYPGRPYFVMELVRGLPVTEYCDKARLSPRQRLELFIDVCHAVQHAHQKGVIHRDLKPSNVMITVHDGRPVAKVIDFGVAKAVGQQLTERTVYTAHTQLVGTPLYMSPEQADFSSQDVDTRSDVYSLGVLLYELLTGQTPFDKETLHKAGFDEMRRIIREDEPPCPSRRFSTLSAQAISTVSQHRSVDQRHLGRVLRGELDWIVMKALEKDRSRRYESASAFAADIQRYLSDKPVLACPPTTMYRFQKFARKHKPALFTATAVALCLILGTTVSAWQAVRATTAEAQANANASQAQEKAKEATEQRDEVRALNSQLRRTLYAAHMNLAHKAWDESNIGRMDELLDQHRPKPGETDLRGFEWHYLYRLCHREILSLKEYGVAVNSVVYSPDGKHLACALDDGTTKVRDAQTGQEILSLKLKDDDRMSVAFSPDGKRLACGSGTWDETKFAYTAGYVRVWDAQTGQELLSIKAHDHAAFLIAFSPDGKRLASASLDGMTKLWDAQTGQELLAFNVHADSGLAFGPDGKRLFGCDGKAIRVWDTNSGQELFTFKVSESECTAAFSPDGKRLAAAGKVRDAESGQELLSLKGSTDDYMIFSPDGKRLVSVGGDGSRTVTVWDSQTGVEISTFKGHSNIVASVAFSPDGTRLATAAYDGYVKVWNTTTRPDAHPLSGLTDKVLGLAISPDGKRLAARTGTWDETKKAYDPVEVKVLDAQTGQQLISIKGLTKASSLWFSPDGKLLASAGDKTTSIWDSESGRELLSLKGHADPTPSFVAFSPDGKRLATANWDKTVKVWDTQTGEELLTINGHKGRVWNVAFSPDGKRLASTSQDATLKVWDAQTGKELLSIGHTWWPGGATFSPDGTRLASVANDHADGTGEINVWDAQTGQNLLCLKGHAFGVGRVIFSPDGKRLVSGSAPRRRKSGEIKVWDAETGLEFLTLKGRGRVALSPDGHRLFSTDGATLEIYDATPLPEKP